MKRRHFLIALLTVSWGTLCCFEGGSSPPNCPDKGTAWPDPCFEHLADGGADARG